MLRVTYPLELFEAVEFSNGLLAEYPLDLLPNPMETESLVLTSREEASIVKSKDYVCIPFQQNVDPMTSSHIMLTALLKHIKPIIVTINSLQKENIDLFLDSLVRRNSLSLISRYYKYYQLSDNTYLCLESAVMNYRKHSEPLSYNIVYDIAEYGFAVLDLSNAFVFKMIEKEENE